MRSWYQDQVGINLKPDHSKVNSTDTQADELRAIRTHICDRTLVALAIATIPALPISLLRVLDSGWHWDMPLHILFGVVLWLVTLLRNRLPLAVKAWYPIIAILLVAVSTQLVRGLMGGAEYLYLGAIVLTFAMQGLRPAIYVSGIALVMTVIAGAAFVNGTLQPLPDQEMIARSMISWSTRIVVFIFVLVLVVSALGVLDRDLQALLSRLGKSQHKLTRQESSLEEIVTERTGSLRESEHRLRRILESTGDGFIMVDTQLMITDVNPAMEAMAHQSRRQLLGQSLMTLVTGRDGDDIAKKLLRESDAIGFEVTLPRPDGSRLDCLVHPSPYYDSKGAMQGAFAMVIDISQIKESARELRLALSQARAGEQAKVKFISMMSHEVRTPLNAVIGMTQLLLRSELDPAQRGFAETILQAGESLLATINNILDFSRLDASTLELETLPFRLDDAVTGVIKDYESRARAKGLTLNIRFAPELPEVVHGDQTRLGQIIGNLVSNGIKFTESGSVSVALSLLRVVDDQAQIVITVTDTGIGMNEAAQAKLFRSFSQSEDDTTRRFEGTGMGLAITRGLVEAMGGTIDVQSTPGKGSRLTVSMMLGLPADWRPIKVHPRAPTVETVDTADATEAVAQPIGDEEEPSSEMPGLRFLIVINDPELSGQAETAMTDFGHHVVLASGGQVALDMLDKNNFDLVVIDTQLADMDGLRVCQEIRRLPGRRARVPIVLLASGRREPDPQILKAMGINSQLAKPVQWAELDQLARGLDQDMGVG